jgi:hypothetical protein
LSKSECNLILGNRQNKKQKKQKKRRKVKMSCPLIHKVTDESPLPDGQKCPIEHTPLDSDLETEDVGADEYKKLKRVMSTITKFYRDGTDLKRRQYEYMCTQLSTLDSDVEMAEAQLEALRAKPEFKEHPKQKSYLNDLQEELSGQVQRREAFVEKVDELKGLWEWSTVIVRVCEWLEACMHEYAVDELKIRPPKGLVAPETPPELSDEQCIEFGEGLDEITYNLQESQDFFRASVDGRLAQYHGVERQIIEAQLDAIRRFPDESPRRQHIEAELEADLAYVVDNMKDDDATMRRRRKMLQSHSDYFKVLKFYKERLAARTPFKSDPSREYDPKYDFNPAQLSNRFSNPSSSSSSASSSEQ